MTDYCTCGARLVEDARFCHRCGRPTSESLTPETASSIPEQQRPAATTLAQIPVSFRNPLALRVAFVMSLGIMLLEMIPGLNLLFAVWWLAAGWAAVLIYRRLTGVKLTTGGGARLGSITGVLTFASMTLTLALTVAVTGRQPLEEMLKQTPQAEAIIHDPLALGVLFLVVLMVLFALVVGTCAAGGALGARFAARGGMSQAPGA